MAILPTVLQIHLYHRDQKDGIFKDIPPFLCINEDNLLIGRDFNCHLKLRDAGISRCQASLEPYLEKGHTSLHFSLKNLSKKSKVNVNGLHLRYLQQMPLKATNKIIFSETQMKIKVLEAEETDEQDGVLDRVSGSKTIQER